MESEITQIEQCSNVAQFVEYVSKFGIYSHSADAEDHPLVKQAITSGYVRLENHGFGDAVAFDLTSEGRRLINMPPDTSLFARFKAWISNLSALRPNSSS